MNGGVASARVFSACVALLPFVRLLQDDRLYVLLTDLAAPGEGPREEEWRLLQSTLRVRSGGGSKYFRTQGQRSDRVGMCS
eukprot:6567021-Alexandrium_andersonii.AAC.1